MQPSSNEQSGLNLPPPVGEQLPAIGVPIEGQPAAPEALPFAAERAAANTQPTVPQMPTIPMPLPASDQQSIQQTDVATATQSSVPPIADDSDLIEKEWVAKAKQIVEQTRQDPNLQSKELSAFKADYMKKRYNKTIKLSE